MKSQAKQSVSAAEHRPNEMIKVVSHAAIFTDDETVKQVSSQERKFCLNNLLAVNYHDNKTFSITNFTSKPIKNIDISLLIKQKNTLIPLGILDEIQPFSHLICEYPFAQQQRNYQTVAGELISLGPDTSWSASDLSFKALSDDLFWKKLQEITIKWQINFKKSSGCIDITPNYARAISSFLTDMAYMITTEAYKEKYINNTFYYDSKNRRLSKKNLEPIYNRIFSFERCYVQIYNENYTLGRGFSEKNNHYLTIFLPKTAFHETTAERLVTNFGDAFARALLQHPYSPIGAQLYKFHQELLDSHQLPIAQPGLNLHEMLGLPPLLPQITELTAKKVEPIIVSESSLFTDDETPKQLYSKEKYFHINKMLEAKYQDNKTFSVTNFSPATIQKATVYIIIKNLQVKIPVSVIDVIKGYSHTIYQYPFSQSAITYQDNEHQDQSFQLDPNIPLDKKEIQFEIVSEDPIYQKLQQIKALWRVGFQPASCALTPQYARAYIKLLADIAHTLSTEAYKKEFIECTHFYNEQHVPVGSDELLTWYNRSMQFTELLFGTLENTDGAAGRSKFKSRGVTANMGMQQVFFGNPETDGPKEIIRLFTHEFMHIITQYLSHKSNVVADIYQGDEKDLNALFHRHYKALYDKEALPFASPKNNGPYLESSVHSTPSSYSLPLTSMPLCCDVVGSMEDGSDDETLSDIDDADSTFPQSMAGFINEQEALMAQPIVTPSLLNAANAVVTQAL